MAPLGRYSIVTADGWMFDFDPVRWNVDIGIPDGFGMPPVQHQTSQLFGLPGKQLDAINIQPRTVTIAASLQGSCLDDLHDVRYQLWKAMRWNRTLDNPPVPFKLYYRNDGNATYLNCYLLDAPTDDIGSDEKNEKTAIKLIAYDPMWYAENESSAALEIGQSLSATYILAKISGVWQSLGGVGTGQVNDIKLSNDGNTVYVAGWFANWAGIANADNIVSYDLTTGVWSALGTGTNALVRRLLVAPDNTLYAVGNFTLAGGVVGTAYVAKWDGSAWKPLGTGLNGAGAALAASLDGSIYVGGQFTTANGVACSNIAKWNGTTFSPLSTGIVAGGYVAGIAVASDGTLYAVGTFTSAGGVSADSIAKWNGTAWSALPVGTGAAPAIEEVIVLKDGSVLAGGSQLTMAGITVNRIGHWNGSSWSAFAGGLPTTGLPSVFKMAQSPDGKVYVGGIFANPFPLPAIADGILCCTGTSWLPLDVDLPGAPTVRGVALKSNGDLFIGFDTTGTINFSSQTTLTCNGDVPVAPVITVTGPGTLCWIENIESAKTIAFSLSLINGETLTINLKNKTLVSSWRGNMFPFTPLLPVSDFSSWSLEPDPIAPLGANTINMLMTSTTPSEYFDNNNQLSGWASITGVDALNTDSHGALYVSIIADGGGFYHVAFYSDAARTQLVGHTATYNGVGAKAVVADNASGLGGTVTVDAVVAADADIMVYYATAKVEWRDAFLSADAAVQ